MARTSFKKRLKRFVKSPRNILITGVLSVLTLTLFFANKGLWRHFTLRREVSVRTTELAKLNADAAGVEREVSLLQLEDVSTMERIARERYNMKRAGETIYREAKN